MNSNNYDNYIDLVALDEAYNNITIDATTAQKQAPELPDGDYKVRVKRVMLSTSKRGNRMLVWELKIIDPDLKRSRTIWKQNMMITTTNLKWLKTDLAICGLILEKLSDLPHNLERLQDLRLYISKQTSNGYANIYFNRLINDEEYVIDSSSNDDIPF